MCYLHNLKKISRRWNTHTRTLTHHLRTYNNIELLLLKRGRQIVISNFTLIRKITTKFRKRNMFKKLPNKNIRKRIRYYRKVGKRKQYDKKLNLRERFIFHERHSFE